LVGWRLQTNRRGRKHVASFGEQQARQLVQSWKLGVVSLRNTINEEIKSGVYKFVLKACKQLLGLQTRRGKE